MDAINNYHFFNFRFNNSTRISFTGEKVVRDHSYLSSENRVITLNNTRGNEGNGKIDNASNDEIPPQLFAINVATFDYPSE